MARRSSKPERDTERPALRPLLQGHLRKGGKVRSGQVDAGVPGQADATGAPEPLEERSVQPASEVADDPGDAARGKATRSPAETAKRPHLEGSEQGPA